MADDKSPYVLVSIFKEDANKQDVEQSTNKISTIIDEWNGQGNTNNIEQLIEHPKRNNEQLLEQKIEQLKVQIEQLEKQLEYVKANEAWLKQQLDQKFIEHKNHEKKGLLGRLFG